MNKFDQYKTKAESQCEAKASFYMFTFDDRGNVAHNFSESNTFCQNWKTCWHKFSLSSIIVKIKSCGFYVCLYYSEYVVLS